MATGAPGDACRGPGAGAARRPAR